MLEISTIELKKDSEAPPWPWTCIPWSKKAMVYEPDWKRGHSHIYIYTYTYNNIHIDVVFVAISVCCYCD